MFGTRLKQLRKEKGLTQKQLADLLYVGRPTIAGYETKGKEPDFDKILWISNYFMVSIDYLLGKTDNRESIADLRAVEILKQKFVQHKIIREGEQLSIEQLDNDLAKLGAILHAFKE